MAANLIEKLQEATKVCEEVSANDLDNQKEQLILQFNALREAIYKIVDEKKMILSTLKWQQVEYKRFDNDINMDEILKNEAKKISIVYGYSFEAVYEILQAQNNFNCKCIKKEYLIDPDIYVYQYWTFKY